MSLRVKEPILLAFIPGQGMISRPYPVQLIYGFWSILVVRHSSTRQTIEFSSFVISGLQLLTNYVIILVLVVATVSDMIGGETSSVRFFILYTNVHCCPSLDSTCQCPMLDFGHSDFGFYTRVLFWISDATVRSWNLDKSVPFQILDTNVRFWILDTSVHVWIF